MKAGGRGTGPVRVNGGLFGSIPGLLVFLAVLLRPLPVWAASQIDFHDVSFGWRGLETSLELGFEQDRQTTSQKDQPTSHYDSDRFLERLHLRGRRIYIYDPRLVTINLSAGIGLYQEKNNFAERSGHQDGRLYDYSIDSTFFSEKPYTLAFYASHAEDRISRNFGTRTDITSDSRGARVSLNEQSFLKDKGFPFFRTSLEVSQLKIKEDSTGNGQDFHRDEKHDLFKYQAHKGFQTADLGFRYRYEDIQDNLRLDNGFSTQTANLDYGLDFGPTLNWRLTSRNAYIRRNGINGNKILTADQNLIIHHNIDFESDYRYHFSRFSTHTGVTTSNLVNVLFRRRYYNQLMANLNAQAGLIKLPEGTIKNYGGGPAINYRRHAFAHGTLNLHAGWNYRINDHNLDSSSVETHNEAHGVAPDFPVGDPGFLLDNPLVEIGSIVIVDRRDGGQLDTTEGLDYEVIAEGDYTRIRPLPTSAVLRANDPLEVTYRYRVEPSIRYANTQYNVGGALQIGWLTFSVAHTASNQHLLSGTDNGLLRDRTTDTASVRAHGTWHRTELDADAGYEKEDSTDQAYTVWRFSQALSYPGFYGYTLTASSVESFVRYNQPDTRSSESYTANIALNGWLHRVWRTRIFVGVLVFNDSEIQNQTMARAGLDIRRRIGKLSLRGRLAWNEFDRGFTNTTDRLIEINAVRRF